MHNIKNAVNNTHTHTHTHTYIYIYPHKRNNSATKRILFNKNRVIYIYIYISSSSSCRAASTEYPDPLSLHVSRSFIASDRSLGLHPVSSHSCCMYVRAGRPAFDWPYAGVHRGTSLTSLSLLLQQCPACLVRLAWIVFVIGGRWPYSWCLVGCCRQDLFNIALNILAV